MKNSLIALGVLAAAMSAPAGATPVNLGADGTGNLGSSTASFLGGSLTAQVVTVSGSSVTSVTSPNLYYKTSGGDETGLGIVAPTENEIYYPYGIELTRTSGVTFNSVVIGSVQNPESWDIRGWNGTSWVELGGSPGVGGAVGGQITVTGLAAYTSILVDTPFANGTHGTNGGADGNNILLDSVDVSNQVPEPAMLSLMGLGLAALGFARRRKA